MPWPFQAGLALCSDIDGCTRSLFLAVHRRLNVDLGLPVADSFFGLGREPDQMAFFMDDGCTPGPDAGLIKGAVRAGLIDSLHSWGDFNLSPPEPGMVRTLGEKLVEEFQKNNLTVPVWINHGDPNNLQNFKARLRPEYQGDDPESPYYTADLARGLGTTFFWDSEMSPYILQTGIHPNRIRTWPRWSLNTLKNGVKLVMGRKNVRRSLTELTSLLRPILIRDGEHWQAFNRFNQHPKGIWGLPTRHTLRWSLDRKNLDRLVSEQGFLIVYTHLGLPATWDHELFPLPDLMALKRLAGYYRDGKVWVAPTGILLEYSRKLRDLAGRAYGENGKIVIELLGIKDSKGGLRPVDPSDLWGLHFYTPNPQSTEIRSGNQIFSPQVRPPDHTGQASVGFPIPPVPDVAVLEM